MRLKGNFGLRLKGGFGFRESFGLHGHGFRVWRGVWVLGRGCCKIEHY